MLPSPPSAVFRRRRSSMIQANVLIQRAAACCVIGLFGAGPLRAEILITTSEAKLPNNTLVERGALPGPRVLLVSPRGAAGVLKSPFKLELTFESRGGVKIDLNSLTVSYKKMPPVDLTQRVKEFVRPAGIAMPAAEVPPG